VSSPAAFQDAHEVSGLVNPQSPGVIEEAEDTDTASPELFQEKFSVIVGCGGKDAWTCV
jgi:hypothetical protein